MIVALNKADLLSSDIIQIAGIAMELPYVRLSALDEECFEANGTRIRGPMPKIIVGRSWHFSSYQQKDFAHSYIWRYIVDEAKSCQNLLGKQ